MKALRLEGLFQEKMVIHSVGDRDVVVLALLCLSNVLEPIVLIRVRQFCDCPCSVVGFQPD